MATMKSVLHFPDGGELIITRELIPVGRARTQGPGISGEGELLTPGRLTATYNGKRASDRKIARLLAGHRKRALEGSA